MSWWRRSEQGTGVSLEGELAELSFEVDAWIDEDAMMVLGTWREVCVGEVDFDVERGSLRVRVGGDVVVCAVADRERGEQIESMTKLEVCAVSAFALRGQTWLWFRSESWSYAVEVASAVLVS
jgi:hypothetical protein